MNTTSTQATDSLLGALAQAREHGTARAAVRALGCGTAEPEAAADELADLLDGLPKPEALAEFFALGVLAGRSGSAAMAS